MTRIYIYIYIYIKYTINIIGHIWDKYISWCKGGKKWISRVKHPTGAGQKWGRKSCLYLLYSFLRSTGNIQRLLQKEKKKNIQNLIHMLVSEGLHKIWDKIRHCTLFWFGLTLRLNLSLIFLHNGRSKRTSLSHFTYYYSYLSLFYKVTFDSLWAFIISTLVIE